MRLARRRSIAKPRVLPRVQRNTRFEREADDSAARALVGETGLSRGLSAIVPSRFDVASSGVPLPIVARARLEAAFGVDLARVRVHSDPASAAVARSLGANAFTAGHDIYFDAQRFDPSGRDGFRLLAHEVAHVVQQTRDAVGARIGDGGVQLEEGRYAIENLAKNHRATWGADSDLDAAILKVELELGETTPMGKTSAAGDVIAEHAKKYNPGRKTSVRSFLVDVLKKLLGDPTTDGSYKYLETAELLYESDTNNEIKCSPSPEMILHLKERRGAKWIEATYDHELIKASWENVYGTFRMMVFNPYATPPPLWATDKSHKTHAEDLQKRQASAPFFMNDRIAAALQKLGDFDESRVKQMQIWLDDAKAASPRVWSQRRYIAEQLQKWAATAKTMSEHVPKALDLFTRLERLGAEGAIFWGKPAGGKDPGSGAMMYLARYEDRVGELADPGSLDQEAIVSRRGILTKTDELLELETILLEQAKAVFALTAAGNVLSVGLYAQTLEAFKNRLAGQARGLGGLVYALTNEQSALGKRLAAAPLGPQLSEDRWAIVGFILGWIAITLERWPVYDASGDTDRHPDKRLYHRHLIAGMLMRIAIFANFPKLEALCRSVLNGTEFADGGSYIAINGRWEEQPTAAMERMILDFGGDNHPLRHVLREKDKPDEHVALAPTIDNLVEFFKLIKLRAFNDTLDTIVNELHDTELKRDTVVDIEPASKAARKAPRPKRWRATGFHAIIHPSDRDQAGKSTVALWQLLVANQKTVEALRPPKNGFVMFPSNVPPLGELSELAAWIVPDLTPMVKELMENGELTKLVPKQDDAYAWLLELSKHPDFTDLASKIQSGLESETRGTKFEHARKLTLLRRVSGFRRRIAQIGIDSEHKVFADEPKAANIPNVDAAMRIAFGYLSNVEPYEDTDEQSAALMMQIAPVMRSAFKESEGIFADGSDSAKHQIAPTWYIFLNNAIAIADAKDGEERLQSVLSARDGDPSAATLLKNMDDVRAIKELLDKAVAENQALFGFKSDGKELTALRVRVAELGTGVGVGKPFEFDGITYVIHKINKPFAFYPRMKAVQGNESKLIVDGKEVEPADRSDRDILFEIEIIDEEEVLPDDVRLERGTITPPSISEELDEEGRTERRERAWESPYFAVSTKHDKILEHMTDVIMWRTMTKGLDRIAIGTEVVGLIAMTVVPGGAKIAIGSMVIELDKMRTDPELLDLIHALTTNPTEVVEKLQTRIAAMFEPDNIWEFLFFSQVHPVFAKLVDIAAQPRQGRKHSKPRGKLGRIVRFIVELGKRMLRVFRRLRLAFRPPIAALHSTFVTHPMLSWLVEKGLDIGDKALSLYEKGDNVMAELDKARAVFGERMIELVDTFRELEMPDELVPTERVVELVTSFILARIPYIRVARPVLDELGATAEIGKWITETFDLKNNVLNPNQMYRREILEPFGAQIRDVREGFLDDFYAVINGVLRELEMVEMEVPHPGPYRVPTVPADEMQAAPSKDRKPDGMRAELPRDAGVPLGRDAARRAMKTFRQDFGHVRIHHDAVADRFTSALGAEAVTSGSHIYLRGSLSTETGVGKQILTHELAHVVQQTGMRSLDVEHPTTPILGRPDRGLQWNPAAEEAAEHAAQSGDPRNVIAFGLQPKLSKEQLKKIAEKMTTLGSGTEFEETLVEGEIADDKRYEALWTSITKLLGKATFAKFLDTKDVKKELVERLKALKADTFKNVALLALDRAERAKPGKKAKLKLDEVEFVRLLEGFVMAKTGITMQVTMRSQNKKQTPIAVDISYLYLPKLDKASPLWKLALENSVHIDPTGTVRLLPANATDKDIAKVQPAVHGRLQAHGPKPFVWDPDSFKLSKRFVRSHVTFGEVLDHEEFAKVSRKDGRGLRVSTHKNLTKWAEGTGRHSHHTTQFVLVQFLRNRHRIKAFPQLPTEVANKIKLNLDSAGLVKSVADRPLTKLDPNDTARGDGMPALLLAADTHLRGNLHINSELDESHDSQSHGERVAQEFFGKLGPLTADSTVDDWSAAISADEGKTVANNIRAGIHHTFTWMYGIMKKPIRSALETYEKPFYERLANVDPAKPDPTYVLTKDDIESVATAAEDNNKTIFGDSKFDKPA